MRHPRFLFRIETHRVFARNRLFMDKPTRVILPSLRLPRTLTDVLHINTKARAIRLADSTQESIFLHF